MDLGNIKSALRFLRLVQLKKQKSHQCFCNNILDQYAKDGARDMCGKSLKKLSEQSAFLPTRMLIPAQNMSSEHFLTRLTDVMPSLLTLRFIEMADAFPIHALKFLVGLPQTIKVVSAPVAAFALWFLGAGDGRGSDYF